MQQAKLRLGRPVRGREPKPQRQTRRWPLGLTPRGERGTRHHPWLQGGFPRSCSHPGKGLQIGWGGEMGSLGWV